MKWTAGINGAILRDGERWAYVEDDGAGFAYDEQKLAQFIVEALNEKEAREAFAVKAGGIMGRAMRKASAESEARRDQAFIDALDAFKEVARKTVNAPPIPS